MIKATQIRKGYIHVPRQQARKFFPATRRAISVFFDDTTPAKNPLWNPERGMIFGATEWLRQHASGQAAEIEVLERNSVYRIRRIGPPQARIEASPAKSTAGEHRQMNFWVFSTTSDSFEVVKARNIWAVSYEKGGKWSVTAVKPDDLLIFYVIKTGQFQGVYRVASAWYRNDELVWPEEQAERKKTAPNEIKLQPIALGNANVKHMIDQLEFIKRKDSRWGAYLLGTPANFRKPISQRDYELILDAVRKSASTLAEFITYEPSESKQVSVTVTPERLHDQLVMTMVRLGEIFGYESEKGVQLYKINSRTPSEQRNRTVDVVWKKRGTYSQCVPVEVQAHGSIDALIRRLKLLEPRAWRMIVVASEQDLKSVSSDVEYSESRAFSEKLIYVPQEKVLETRDHVPAIHEFKEFLKLRLEE